MSTTKFIFNTPKHLHAAAMRKAKQDGVTLSAFLNFATRAYVRGELRVGTFDTELLNSIAEARRGVMDTQENVFARVHALRAKNK
jgi:predicted ATPase